MGSFATDTLCLPHLGVGRGGEVGGGGGVCKKNAIKQWRGPPGADIDGLLE